MDSLIKKLFEIATGKKAKIFWAVFLAIIVILLVLYPYIDANFLVFSRINKRIDILERVFSKNKKDNISVLKKIFNNVMSAILCVFIGYFCALIGKNIPTIINVWLNAVGFPLIQIAIIGLIVYGTSKNNKE